MQTYRRMSNNLRHVRREYPRSIWALTGGTFINSFGGSMVFPLFTLFFTQKFGISVAQAGLLIVLFTVGGLIGGPLGGYLFDTGHSQLIWLGSLVLGLAVAFGFRASGPQLRAREAMAEART